MFSKKQFEKCIIEHFSICLRDYLWSLPTAD